MKNSIKVLAAMAMAATALFASCQKSENPSIQVQNQNTRGIVYINADAPCTKVTVVDGATSLDITGWKVGDKLNLYKVTAEGTKSVSNAVEFVCENAAQGTFRGYLEEGDPALEELNYATTGTITLSGNKINIYAPKQTSTKVEDVILLFGKRAPTTGVYNMQIAGIILAVNNKTNSAIDVAVKGYDGTNYSFCAPYHQIYEGECYGRYETKATFADAKFSLAKGMTYVFLSNGIDTNKQFGLCTSDDGGTTSKCSIVPLKWFGVDETDGTYFPYEYSDEAPVLTSGSFSVSKSKTVKFTLGNLYWDGSAWQIESSQVGYPTTWSASHVGHFYFAKTAANAYASTFSECTSSTANPGDKFFCDGSDNDHKLTVGAVSGLYALSQAEWEYLINGRGNADNKRKDGVTVGGVAGCLILAPDLFGGTLKSSYTLEELAADGLVCLPVAGSREGETVHPMGEYYPSGGCYWTTTLYSDSYPFYACTMFVVEGNVSTDLQATERNCGVAIRLVQ